jgi:LPXTG-motif cell wall-anchored protein
VSVTIVSEKPTPPPPSPTPSPTPQVKTIVQSAPSTLKGGTPSPVPSSQHPGPQSVPAVSSAGTSNASVTPTPSPVPVAIPLTDPTPSPTIPTSSPSAFTTQRGSATSSAVGRGVQRRTNAPRRSSMTWIMLFGGIGLIVLIMYFALRRRREVW